MPRAQILSELVRHALESDREGVKRVVASIAADERKKKHVVLADSLENMLLRAQSPMNGQNRAHSGTKLNGASKSAVGDLLIELRPQRPIESLVLEQHVRSAIEDLIAEHARRDVLYAHGLHPRHRIMLDGPPGNGKTVLAEAVAESLMLPLFVVRYESVIGSYLGETASRLRKVFDHVLTHECVLFFDEFDTLGKERGDTHETGEIKRVVSSLLLQMDALPSHVILIVATNHLELLDRAVGRRFELRLQLNPPKAREVRALINMYCKRQGLTLDEASLKRLPSKLAGRCYAEIEQFLQTVHRKSVLAFGEPDMPSIVTACLSQLPEALPKSP